MDMCYDGTLVMPSSYAMMEEEEMSYVEGGINRTYSGSQGWAVAALLGSVGAFLAGVCGGLSKTIISGCVAGGPIAWIVGGLTAAILALSGTIIGGAFISAGRDAAYYMCKKGSFNLKNVNAPSFLSVS